jgi:hypothetical protein
MKYINIFDSIEDYIEYKENKPEKLPAVNRVFDNNIYNINKEQFKESFSFIEDEDNTNYNIIKCTSPSGFINTIMTHVMPIVYDEYKNTNTDGENAYEHIVITKNYKWDPLKKIPSYALVHLK